MPTPQEHFEQAQQEYLQQQYPGDLADVLEQESASATPNHTKHLPSTSSNHKSWPLLLLTLAALLFVGVTIGAFQWSGTKPDRHLASQLPSSAPKTSTAKTSTAKSKRVPNSKLFHLKKPVALRLSTKKRQRASSPTDRASQPTNAPSSFVIWKTTTTHKPTLSFKKRHVSIWKTNSKQLVSSTRNPSQRPTVRPGKSNRNRPSSKFRFQPIRSSLFRSS